jgi:hypothetical protein
MALTACGGRGRRPGKCSAACAWRWWQPRNQRQSIMIKGPYQERAMQTGSAPGVCTTRVLQSGDDSESSVRVVLKQQ